MNITIWNEHPKEEQKGAVRRAYPQGMQQAIADIFPNSDYSITISSQNLPDNGLSDETLKDTDVLLYWAHSLHDKLLESTAERIAKRVAEGMGIIFLHSAHFSKPFKKIMGTSGSLKWREDGRHERLFNVNPNHPIANGVPEHFFLPKEEMYGEYFDIPTPDDLIFIGWYPGGEVFRSGFTYHYGEGKVFYFQPGHETYPTYYDANVKTVLHNAVLWAAGETVQQVQDFVTSDCAYMRPFEKKVLKCCLKA